MKRTNVTLLLLLSILLAHTQSARAGWVSHGGPSFAARTDLQAVDVGATVPLPLPPCGGPPPEYGRLLKSYAFEDGLGGSSTEGWTSVDSSGFGNFAGLVSGPSVLQQDPVNTNTTHFWSFFNGSSTNYACGGFPAQLAVPKTTHPGSFNYNDYLHNVIVSPWIDLSLDANGVPVPSSFNSVALTLDVYTDMPLDNLVFYDWHIRFRVGGAPTAWEADIFVYYSPQKLWQHRGFDFAVTNIPAGATDVQVAIGARDLLWTFYGVGSGACHSHGPLIDNVCVSRTNGKVHTVTSTADNNTVITLRRAINDSNTRLGQDVIFFNIPGPGTHSIQFASALPAITDELIIDGYTQPGASPNTNPVGSPSNAQIMIDIHGGFTGDGFVFNAPGTLRGIASHSFYGRNVVVQADPVVIEGNYFGLDPSGSGGYLDLVGIWIQANNCHVGGETPAARNVISEGSYQTVGVQLEGAWNTHIFGNYFGTAPNLIGVGNGNEIAVLVEAGAQSNSYGLATPGGGNIFSDNGAAIAVRGPGTISNGIEGNSLRANSIGIDLGSDGRTANDPGDVDDGPNRLQNFPDLTTATGSEVTGVMHGAPGTSLVLNFYRSSACYLSGGEVYLGESYVTTNGSGDVPFTFTSPQPIPPGSYITATARDWYGSTSELSDCVYSVNTPAGSNVVVSLLDASNAVRGTATFSQVTNGENTILITPYSPPVPITGSFYIGDPNDASRYFNVFTNASYSGGVDVCFFYDENNIPGPEANLVLAHYDGSNWQDVTTTRDLVNNKICGHVTTLSPFAIAVLTPTGVGDTPVPATFALHPNVPNPFNPQTTIQYDVPTGGSDVNISVYDVAGRLVRELVNEHRDAGTWSAQWHGEDDRGSRVASGVYFYRMRAGEFVETKKMVLLK